MWNRGKIAIKAAKFKDFLSDVSISDTDSGAGFLDFGFSSFMNFPHLFWITVVYLKVFILVIQLAPPFKNLYLSKFP